MRILLKFVIYFHQLIYKKTFLGTVVLKWTHHFRRFLYPPPKEVFRGRMGAGGEGGSGSSSIRQCPFLFTFNNKRNGCLDSIMKIIKENVTAKI
jgi:hypothetical protein